MQLFKGASSHWINEQNLVNGKFAWGRGYAAFSISESVLPKILKYIASQEEHHKHKSFREEYHQFLERHGLAPGEAEQP